MLQIYNTTTSMTANIQSVQNGFNEIINFLKNNLQDTELSYSVSSSLLTMSGKIYGKQISPLQFGVGVPSSQFPYNAHLYRIFYDTDKENLIILASNMLDTILGDGTVTITSQATYGTKLGLFCFFNGKAHTLAETSSRSASLSYLTNVVPRESSFGKDSENYILYPLIVENEFFENVFICGNKIGSQNDIITDGVNNFKCMSGVFFYKI